MNILPPLIDYTRDQLTRDWDVGSYKITAEQLESDIATGTAPLIIASTTVVSNLNVDQVDGKDSTDFFNLAGQAGGQVAYGGTAASNTYRLLTTSHATKGIGNLSDTLYIVEATKYVGVNQTSPTRQLEVVGDANYNNLLYVKQTGLGAAIGINRTDGTSGMLIAGSNAVNFLYDEDGDFAVSKHSKAAIDSGNVSGLSRSLYILGSNDYAGFGSHFYTLVPPAHPIDVYNDQNSSTLIHTENPNTGTGAYAGFMADSDTSQLRAVSFGSGLVTTRYGVTLASFSEIQSNSGNGLLIGTGTNDAPIIFGTNSLEVLRITDTETIFNDASNDMDFRFETNGVSNAFVINGGSDQIEHNTDTAIADGKNVILNTTTGTKFGTATTQKLAFYNSTPVVQPTALTGQETTITFTEPGTPDYALQDMTNSSPWGFADGDEARTFVGVVENLQVRVDEIETKLQSLGLLA